MEEFMKRKIIFFTILIFAIKILFAFNNSPIAYLERIGGNDKISSSGTLLIVVENPNNSGEPITKILITIPSGFSVSSGYITVLGQGIGNISDFSGPIIINFSSYLMPGSKVYIFLKNVTNPSSAGNYTWNITAYGIGNNQVNANVYPGKTLNSTIVSYTGFRNIPYGKVFVSGGNAAAATGIKQLSIANTKTEYLLFNPFDSGETINEILLKIPSAYATVAGTTIVVSNIIAGTQLASITPGAIAAGNQKNIIFSSLTINPGDFISISSTLLTHPAAAGNYTWELWVKGVSSGQYVKVIDWPGISNAQTVNIIAAPAAGWYADIFPYYDVIAKQIGWNTAGTSNNVYRICLWKTTATTIASDPKIEFPSGYDLSLAGVANTQNNGAGAGTIQNFLLEVHGG